MVRTKAFSIHYSIACSLSFLNQSETTTLQTLCKPRSPLPMNLMKVEGILKIEFNKMVSSVSLVRFWTTSQQENHSQSYYAESVKTVKTNLHSTASISIADTATRGVSEGFYHGARKQPDLREVLSLSTTASMCERINSPS